MVSVSRYRRSRSVFSVVKRVVRDVLEEYGVLEEWGDDVVHEFARYVSKCLRRLWSRQYRRRVLLYYRTRYSMFRTLVSFYVSRLYKRYCSSPLKH